MFCLIKTPTGFEAWNIFSSLQTYGHVVQQVSVQPSSAGHQPSSPPSVSVLQSPPEAPLGRDRPVDVPKPLMPPAKTAKAVEALTHSISQNEAFLQHLQQVRALKRSCRAPHKGVRQPVSTSVSSV